jgi:hypothetical protein
MAMTTIVMVMITTELTIATSRKSEGKRGTNQNFQRMRSSSHRRQLLEERYIQYDVGVCS